MAKQSNIFGSDCPGCDTEPGLHVEWCQKVKLMTNQNPKPPLGCTCELRHRSWNPLTGICETCDSRFRDLKAGLRSVTKPKPPDEVELYLGHSGEWIRPQGTGYYSDEPVHYVPKTRLETAETELAACRKSRQSAKERSNSRAGRIYELEAALQKLSRWDSEEPDGDYLLSMQEDVLNITRVALQTTK